MKPIIAVYAGTFDPPTRGHLWMIEHASSIFDKLVVAIGVNPDKRCLFSIAERLEMLRHISLPWLPGTQVTSFENKYLVHYARSIGADYIVRGLRNEDDFRYEQTMRNINGELVSSIETVFLMPPDGVRDVSSSMVKGLIGPEGWRDVVKHYVPEAVYKKILEKKGGV